MALIVLGNQFTRDLEKAGALALYAPLEGGFEGRYQRRLRAAGYQTLHITARGLGDLSAYLTGVHGIRPAHLGKKTIGREGAVGARYYAPAIVQQYLDQLPARSKGLAIWLLEGFVLSTQELEFLCLLTQQTPRLKIVVELGGDRTCRWQPLQTVLAAA